MRETDPPDASEWTTLTVSPDSISAQMAQEVLRSAGIDSLTQEVGVRSQTAFLSGIHGGFQVLVHPRFKDEAQAVLNPEAIVSEDALNEAIPHEEIDQGDVGARSAGRALQVAVLGFLLGPLLHPFSLIMALRALQRKDLPSRSRRDARVAAGISLFSLAFFAILIHSFLR